MKLTETRYDNAVTGCCAPLDRTRWDNQTLVWENKPFLKDHVREILHVPINFDAVMRRDHKAIDDAEAWPEQPFTLADEVSPWGADVYTAVDKDVPGAEMAHISGTFLARAFEGPFKYMPYWIQEMSQWVEDQGKKVEHMYFYYATCPDCSKKLGRNEVVLLARVD